MISSRRGAVALSFSVAPKRASARASTKASSSARQALALAAPAEMFQPR